MATITQNGPKANKGEIKGIIRFLKDLLPNKLVSAISTLLHPCCSLSGTGTASCTDIRSFNVTLNLDQPLPTFPGTSYIYVFVNLEAVGVGTLTTPNTITTTLNFSGSGIVNETRDVKVLLLYPTNTDETIGAYHTFIIPGVVFNGNPCD